MKILAIGDPHGNLNKLMKIPKKKIDLILITGDLGKADLARKIEMIEKRDYLPKEAKKVHMEIHNSTLKVLRYLSKFAPVYTIQGNVGISKRSNVKRNQKKYGIKIPVTKELIDKMSDVKLIKNKLRNINGLRIGFLEYYTDVSWIKNFKPEKYRKKMKRAKKQTDKARRVLERFKKLDILICHQPPYGILDKVNFPGAPKNWQGKHAGGKAILNYIKK